MELLSVTVTKVNAGGVSGVWIEGYSRARVRFSDLNVNLNPGETISGYYVLFDGVRYNANSSRLATTGGMNSGENELHCVVYGTDSEGNEISSELIQTVEAYAYVPPAGNYSAIRCDADGVEDNEGGYLKVTSDVTCSSLGGANVCTTTVRWRIRGAALWTEAGSITGSDALIFGAGLMQSGVSYDILLSLSDTVGNTGEYSELVVSDFWAMKFSSDGRGVSFGKKTATSGYLELADGMGLKLGATSLSEQQLIDLLGMSAGMVFDQLWSNSSLTTAFAAQTVSLDLSPYKLCLITFKMNTSTDLRCIGMGLVGTAEYMGIMGSTTGTAYVYKRTFKPKTTGVVFATGYRNNTAGTGYMIPAKIFGVS